MKRIDLGTSMMLSVWEPEVFNGTSLFIMHGMVEHLGRYEPLIQTMNRQGILVAGFHYPGHGENLPLGVMEADMVDEILDMMQRSHQWLREQGTRRLVHFAHSLGTYFTRLALDEIHADHVILSGTAYIDEQKIRRTLPLIRFLGKVLRRNRVHAWLLKLVFEDFRKPYGKGGDNLQFVSSQIEEQHRYRQDPLCGFSISIGFVEMLANLSGRLIERERQLMHFPAPVTLMSGKGDSVGLMGRAPEELAAALSGKEGTVSRVILYDARHEILNDISRQAVMDDILSICS